MKIVLENLCYRYDGAPVLQDICLTLPAGSRTVVMGRSGRGKTTLLQLLAGMLQPDSGRLEGLTTAALLFQENRLLPWCTVWANLQVALPDQPEALLRSTLARLGLGDWADRYPAELSGGMARRVALARALLLPSDLLLLDEPFAGLDDAAKADAAALTLELLGNRTLVAVLHDAADAALLDAAIVELD